MAGAKFGGSKFGGAKYGGQKMGGAKYGASAPKDEPETKAEPKEEAAEAPKKEYGGNKYGGQKMGGNKYGGGKYGGGKFGGFTSKAEAKEDYFDKPKVRLGGVGEYKAGAGNKASAEGRASIAAAKSTPKSDKAKMAAPKSGWKADVKPAKPAYKAKGVPDYNKDLGDLYLNATAGMFSPKAGGKKK